MANTWRTIATSLKREKFMAFTNIFVMTVSFLVLGFFVSVIFISQSALQYLENQAQITVFFKDDFSEENILHLRDSYQTEERISTISYVSKEDAFKIFTELNSEEPVLMESISVDILPASLEIKAKDVSQLSAIASEFSSLEGVEEVKYFEDVIEKFKVISNVSYVVGFVLVTVFLILSYSLIINNLRMTISAKGEELEIQKLVGASDKYVKKPLIYQGMFYGVAASVIATVILFLAALLLSTFHIFSDKLPVPFMDGTSVSLIIYALILGIILITSGVFLGFFGSWTAIKKYLNY